MTEHLAGCTDREMPDASSLGALCGSPMEMRRFLTLAIGIAAALSDIHQQHIIHKNITPACIMVDKRSNSVSIGDFSSASLLPYEYPSVNNLSILKGALPYISPEQTGRMNRVIDYRTDLYSLGVIFYEMLTGMHPFQASDAPGWVHCHIARLPKAPALLIPSVPLPVSDLVMRLLAKTAEDRYQTASGLKSDLEKCLAGWKAGCGIEPFILGDKDVSDRLLIPQKLYGRERDVKTLQDAFERVATQGASEMALVAGYSGIGKTSLVRELYKLVVRDQGIFISGKFDQYKRNIPYLTIAEAFRELIQQILTESGVQAASWRERFLGTLGDNAQVVIEVIPQLELILGKQPAVPELPPSEAHYRFNMVFRQFIGVFTRKEHPLVLFLDDLQWVDPASLKLIEDVVTHAETRHLLLIGAYRDNEVDPSHPLMLVLDNIRKSGTRLATLTLAPLLPLDLSRLLAETFRNDQARLEPLSALIYRKTAGNPFFVIQFLTALHGERLVEFDWQEGCWHWDVDRIHTQGYTENVVDLVVSKLRKLSPGAQEALKLAACIGNRFELRSLAAISMDRAEEIRARLWEAMREGLVLLLEEGEYAFLHDRVQQAAYSLIPKRERQKVHLRIGRLMLNSATKIEVEERVFDIVHQFNLGRVLLSERDEKYRVAELNLLAGRKAQASTAYTAALTYFTAGTRLLDEEAWKLHYALSFNLYKELAVVEYLNSDYAHSKELIDLLLGKARSDLERAQLHNILIVQYTLMANYADAIRSGREALRLLEIVVPDTNLKEELGALLAQNSRILGERKIASLLDDPDMSNPVKIISLELLSNMVVPARYTDSTLFALITVLNVNISLRFGLTPKSTVGYTAYGMVLNSVMGQYREALEFGELSLRLSDRFTALAQKCQACFMIGHYLNHWVRHLKWADETLNGGVQAGLASGEMQWTGYIFAYKLFQPFYRGADLERIGEEIPNLLFFTRKTRNQWATDTLLGLQLALCELDGSQGPPEGCPDQERFFSDCQEHRSLGAKGRYLVLKAQILFLYGRHEEALEFAGMALELQGFYSSSISVAALNFYHSLALAALFETLPAERKDPCLATIEANQQQMRIWADHCPANFSHLYLLVEAERARLAGRELEGQRLYEQAIRAAAEAGFPQDEGLAHELASRFYRQRGYATSAEAHLRQARRCYLRWGGKGKVKQLDREFPLLVASEPLGAIQGIDASIGQLDAVAVVKASQAISGKIQLPDLIDSLMRIVVENAGAQQGCLILSHGDELSFAATARVAGNEITVQHEMMPLSSDSVPLSLLNYVQRTGESVILDDASGQTLFSKDRYLVRTKPLSVLCLPINRQSSLIGLLYLENNLAPGAFTPDRIAVLELLASQAAISLENASLYQERARAEAALRASEEHYRAIYENCGTALIFIEEDTTITICNKEFEKLYGAGKYEIENRTKWTELVARPEDLLRMKQYHDLRRSSPGSAPQTYEFQMMTRKGELKDLVASVTIMPGTRQSMASLLDITERRQAVAELREKAERIQLLLNSTGEGIYGVDLEGRCTFINQAALRALGYDDPEKFLGKHLHYLIHHTRRDGSSYPSRECEALRPCQTGVPIKVSDQVFWRRDGSSFPVEYRSHPVEKAGVMVGAVCTFHDITERKKAEEKIARMATIIDQAAEGIILTDTRWVIQYANPAFGQLTGYERNEVVGLPMGIFKSSSHDGEFYKNIRETLLRGDVWSGRVINKKKDGSLYEVDATGTPVRDESGNIISFIGIQHDISNEIKLERQLRQAQKMEAMGTLAGGIAHDFNNILTAIFGFTQILSLKLPAETPLRSYLEQILNASHRAAELVKQILAFSRKTEQERKPEEVSLIVKEVLKLIRSSLPATIEIRQQIDIAPQQDVVLADSTQLHQVLMNLCTNAAHAMRAHGGVLTMSLSTYHEDHLFPSHAPELQPGTYVKLVLSDSGHGMDEATTERIFDPYFTTKGPGEGTGLGLAVVQGIVKSHGGAINVYSEPGQGTSFTILLPQATNQNVEQPAISETPPGGNERILFVDDEEALADLGHDLLENLGYQVAVRTSSAEALGEFRAAPDAFDLVITDMTMPSLTGEELAREILTIRPGIPIIIYTGYVGEGLPERARAAGISEILMKPYDILQLATIIRRTLDRAKAIDARELTQQGRCSMVPFD